MSNLKVLNGQMFSEVKSIEVAYPLDRFYIAYESDNQKDIQIRLETTRVGNTNEFGYTGQVYVNHYNSWHSPGESGYETAIVSFETFVEFMREAIPELVKREQAKLANKQVEDLAANWVPENEKVCSYVGCANRSVMQFVHTGYHRESRIYRACLEHEVALEKLRKSLQEAPGFGR